MNYKTINEFKIERHPWKPYISKNSSKLILGTFPTAENNRGAFEFYYPNPNNDFWRIIFTVAGKNLADEENINPIKLRKEILKQLKLGICDIGRIVFRQKNSSKDSDLFPIEFTDIFSILEKNLTINKIIITSSSGSNSVLSWFIHYCNLNNVNFEIPEGKLPKRSNFIFKNRIYRIEIISSPSRLSRIKGNKQIEMYRNAILID